MRVWCSSYPCRLLRPRYTRNLLRNRSCSERCSGCRTDPCPARSCPFHRTRHWFPPRLFRCRYTRRKVHSVRGADKGFCRCRSHSGVRCLECSPRRCRTLRGAVSRLPSPCALVLRTVRRIPLGHSSTCRAGRRRFARPGKCRLLSNRCRPCTADGRRCARKRGRHRRCRDHSAACTRRRPLRSRFRKHLAGSWRAKKAQERALYAAPCLAAPASAPRGAGGEGSHGCCAQSPARVFAW